MYRYFISIIFIAVFFAMGSGIMVVCAKNPEDEKLYLLLAYDAKNRHKFEKSYKYLSLFRVGISTLPIKAGCWSFSRPIPSTHS